MPAAIKRSEKNPSLIIFTDLDGTLLDSTYSFKKALPAIEMIKEKNIPLILCSSKTRTEIEDYRKKLKNEHPFVTENGGGIYIPKRYFKFQTSRLSESPEATNFKLKIEEDENYYIIKLGASYIDLKNALNELRSEGFDVVGFGDMSMRKIMELTGLRTSDAKMAKQREFDEPFIFKGNETALRRLKQSIKSKGFNLAQGDFFHIMGGSNKGRAIEILKKLFHKQNCRMITAALGDSPNDIEMLREVDYPIIVKKNDGSYDRRVRIKKIMKADGIGPEGWNRAVIKLLETLLF